MVYINFNGLDHDNECPVIEIKSFQVDPTLPLSNLAIEII